MHSSSRAALCAHSGCNAQGLAGCGAGGAAGSDRERPKYALSACARWQPALARSLSCIDVTERLQEAGTFHAHRSCTGRGQAASAHTGVRRAGDADAAALQALCQSFPLAPGYQQYLDVSFLGPSQSLVVGSVHTAARCRRRCTKAWSPEVAAPQVNYSYFQFGPFGPTSVAGALGCVLPLTMRQSTRAQTCRLGPTRRCLRPGAAQAGRWCSSPARGATKTIW